MSESKQLNRHAIQDCHLENLDEEDMYCGRSISLYLKQLAEKMKDLGRDNCSTTIELLSFVSSMTLNSDNKSYPFKPAWVDHINHKKTFDLEHITKEHLNFFDEVLIDINNKFLLARLADLLWLLKSPRNPNHATMAIDAYNSRKIDHKTWNKGLSNDLKRAVNLCIQINDFERLKLIKNKLFEAQLADYPESKFLNYWIADFMDKLRIDSEFRESIANKLFTIAEASELENDLIAAETYYKLSAKKYKQSSNIDKHIKCLIGIARSLENEADRRSLNSNLTANAFYDDALRAYRNIPNKYRSNYNVNSKIDDLHKKIISSGKEALDEMSTLKTDSVDISELIKLSMAHVQNKPDPYTTLLFFAGLSAEPDFNKMLQTVKATLGDSVLSNIFGGRYFSDDGRVIAKTQPLKIEKIINKDVVFEDIEHQFYDHYKVHLHLTVVGMILPALNQINLEHRFTKELLIKLCQLSPLVPDDRIYLTGSALWYGFEQQFGIAIHLLCPQFENIVRCKLQEAGAITTNVDNLILPTENSLKTLLKEPKAEKIFGKDLLFEMKALFVEPLGFNCRNNTAHGLLSDENASYSVGSIYAWWMVLRLVINSISHRFY